MLRTPNDEEPSMQSMTFKTGDTPPVLVDLTEGGAPLNLVGASVVFLMRDTGGGAPDIESPAVIEGIPQEGHVRYNWGAGETDIPGEYEASFRVTFSSGEIQTFPNDDFILIIIEASVDSGVAPSIPALPDFCWPIDEGCCSDFDNYAPSVRNRAKALAGQTLRALTAGRVGGCAITVRPCSAAYCDGAGVYWEQGYLRPINWNGVWTNMACGCLNACYHGDGIKLQGPVGRVDSVLIDGIPLDPSTYYVHGNTLIRRTGQWPATQNMAAPTTEIGTFAVTYLRAHPVDGLGAYVAGILACEFAKACSGAKGCRLPAGVTEITRAGVSMTIASGAFPGGVTGIREVDADISAWTPSHAQARPSVWTP
jgi:hypothetical protein